MKLSKKEFKYLVGEFIGAAVEFRDIQIAEDMSNIAAVRQAPDADLKDLVDLWPTRRCLEEIFAAGGFDRSSSISLTDKTQSVIAQLRQHQICMDVDDPLQAPKI